MHLLQIGQKFFKSGERIEKTVKFVKGKSFLDGAAYTGTIMSSDKSGVALFRTFENGFLQEASRVKEGKILSSKKYSYSNGNISKVVDSDNKTIFERIPTNGDDFVRNTKSNYFVDKNTGAWKWFESPSGALCDKIVVENKWANEIANYPDAELVKNLKQVTGSMSERINKYKDLILSSRGINPQFLKVEAVKHNPNNTFIAGFNKFEAKIYYDEILTGMYEPEMVLAIMRHELDHAEMYAKLAKSLGVENYKKLIISTLPKEKKAIAESTFPASTWERLAKEVNIEGFDTQKYKNAVTNYPKQGKFYYPKQLVNYVLTYFNNAFEHRAYNLQYSLLKEFNMIDTGGFCQKKLAENIAKQIGRLKGTVKEGVNPDDAINNALHNFTPSRNDTASYFNDLLNYLKNIKTLS